MTEEGVNMLGWVLCIFYVYMYVKVILWVNLAVYT